METSAADKTLLLLEDEGLYPLTDGAQPLSSV